MYVNATILTLWLVLDGNQIILFGLIFDFNNRQAYLHFFVFRSLVLCKSESMFVIRCDTIF